MSQLVDGVEYTDCIFKVVMNHELGLSDEFKKIK